MGKVKLCIWDLRNGLSLCIVLQWVSPKCVPILLSVCSEVDYGLLRCLCEWVCGHEWCV